MLRARIAAGLALLVVATLSPPVLGRVLADTSRGQAFEPAEPAAVLQRFLNARNHGDVGAAMQLVNDDVTYMGTTSCTAQDPCVGASAFRRALEVSVANQVQATTLGAGQVSGTTVRVSTLVTSPSRTALGVDRTLAEVAVDIVDGKIVRFQTAPDSDDAQTYWWLGHQSAAKIESPSAPVATGGKPAIRQQAPMSLRVTQLDIDTYFDDERRLVVLTRNCGEPAPVDTDVVVRLRLDTAEPELAFPLGQACDVTFIGGDNAYLTSPEAGIYRDVVSGQEFETVDCPTLSGIERALVVFNRVILMGEQAVACHIE